MRTVTASEANQSFSRLLGEAKAGAEITITQRGEPVAKLVPIGLSTEERARRAVAMQAAIAEWETRPVIVAGPWTRDELYD